MMDSMMINKETKRKIAIERQQCYRIEKKQKLLNMSEEQQQAEKKAQKKKSLTTGKRGCAENSSFGTRKWADNSSLSNSNMNEKKKKKSPTTGKRECAENSSLGTREWA